MPTATALDDLIDAVPASAAQTPRDPLDAMLDDVPGTPATQDTAAAKMDQVFRSGLPSQGAPIRQNPFAPQTTSLTPGLGSAPQLNRFQTNQFVPDTTSVGYRAIPKPKPQDAPGQFTRDLQSQAEMNRLQQGYAVNPPGEAAYTPPDLGESLGAPSARAQMQSEIASKARKAMQPTIVAPIANPFGMMLLGPQKDDPDQDAQLPAWAKPISDLGKSPGRGANTIMEGAEQMAQPAGIEKARGAGKIFTGGVRAATPALGTAAAMDPLQALAWWAISKGSTDGAQQIALSRGMSPEDAQQIGEVVGDVPLLFGLGKMGVEGLRGQHAEIAAKAAQRFQEAGDKTPLATSVSGVEALTEGAYGPANKFTGTVDTLPNERPIPFQIKSPTGPRNVQVEIAATDPAGRRYYTIVDSQTGQPIQTGTGDVISSVMARDAVERAGILARWQSSLPEEGTYRGLNPVPAIVEPQQTFEGSNPTAPIPQAGSEQSPSDATSSTSPEGSMPQAGTRFVIDPSTGKITTESAPGSSPEEPPASPLPPEPPPPTKSERVSPDTPNPPTAALPTTPEAPETIALQMQQLGTGQRKMVLVPKGTVWSGNYPPGTATTSDGFGNIVVYRNDMTTRGDIKRAAKNNTLHELLGSTAMGMGTVDKSAIQGEPITVVARAADGTEAQSTVTDAAHLATTVVATQHVTPPGGTVSVEPPEQVIGQRQGEAAPAPASPAPGNDLDSLIDEVPPARTADLAAPRAIPGDQPTTPVAPATTPVAPSNATLKWLADRRARENAASQPESPEPKQEETGLTPAARPQARKPTATEEKFASPASIEAPEIGPHGPIFREYGDDWRGARDRLLAEGTGETPGALMHPQLNQSTDLVFGKEGATHEEGYGLSKIRKWHPEVLEKLGDIFARLPIVNEGPNRIRLSDGVYTAVVRKDWEGGPKHWLLTEFKRSIKGEAEPSTGRTTDVSGAHAMERQTPPSGGPTHSVEEKKDLASPQSLEKEESPKPPIIVTKSSASDHRTPEQIVWDAMERIDRGGHILVRELRVEAGLDKTTFDAALLSLARQQKIELSRHDDPFHAFDREELVPTEDGKTYYVAIAPQPGAQRPEPPAQSTKSFKAELKTTGEGDHWTGDAARFATREEAQKAGRDAWHNSTGTSAVRVVESEDEPNYRWDNQAGLVAINKPEAKTDLAAPKSLEKQEETPVTTSAPAADTASGAAALVDAVYQKLKAAQSLGNVTELTKMAEQAFGSSRTSGQWSPKEMFDAMEAGINKYIANDIGRQLMEMPFEDGIQVVRQLMTRITSQGVRTDEQITKQQFSTPPTESYLASKVADVRSTDVMLEPSAGNGGLAAFAKSIGATVYVNEIGKVRQAMIEAAGFGSPTAHDGEIINALLDPAIKPTVIVMNPPFSAGALKSHEAKNRNQYGFNHVDSALQRLAPGGRLVAILGGGQANEPNGGASLTGGQSGKWFEKIGRKYNIRANIRIHGKEYQKYGTSFATRLIVIDKDGPTTSLANVVRGNVDTVEEAYGLLKTVAESRPEVSARPGGAPSARPDEPGTGVATNPDANTAGDTDAVSGGRRPAAEGQLSGGPAESDGGAGIVRPGAGDQSASLRESEPQAEQRRVLAEYPVKSDATAAAGQPDAGFSENIQLPKLQDTGKYTRNAPDSHHEKLARIAPIELPEADSARAIAQRVNRNVIEVISRWRGKPSDSYSETNAALNFHGDALTFLVVKTEEALLRYTDPPAALVTLRNAAASARQSGRSLVLVGDLIPEIAQLASREELDHALQVSLLPPGKMLVDHLGRRAFDLLVSPEGEKALATLTNGGYERLSLGQAASEVGVRLMVPDRYEELGNTKEEAGRLAQLYAKLLEEEYGKSATEEIRARIEEAYPAELRGRDYRRTDRTPDVRKTGETPDEGINENRSRRSDSEDERRGDRTNQVTLGSGLGALQEPLVQLYQQDLLPTAKTVTRTLRVALDDIQKLLAPQTRGEPARKGAGLLREMGAELDQRRDRAVAALQAFRKHFNGYAKEHGVHGLSVYTAAETGNTSGLSPVDQAFAKVARKLFDDRKAELTNLGLVRHYIDNYMPHEYKKPEAAARWIQNWQSKRPMAGSEDFRKQRTYPTMQDALEDPDFTLEAKFDNPVDFVLSKLGQMDKSILAHYAFEELHDEGRLLYATSPRKVPLGKEAIDDKIFKVFGPQRGAVEINPAKQAPKPETADFASPEEFKDALNDWNDDIIQPEDVHVFGRREMGRYYADEPLAYIINSQLAPGISHTDSYGMLRSVGNTMNLLELSWSYYHGLTTTLNATFSDLGLGAKQIAAGKPIEGLTSIARAPYSVVDDYLKGTKLQKVWDGTAVNPDPMQVAICDAMKRGGGKARMDAYYATDYTQAMIQSWQKQGNPIGSALGAAWRAPLALMEQMFTKPLMEKLVPRVKMGAFLKRAMLELQMHPDMGIDEARERFGKIWDAMDDRFGQLSQRNMMLNPTVRDLLNVTVGRLGWQVGTARAIGGGGFDTVKFAADMAKWAASGSRGAPPEFTDRMAYLWVGLLLGGAIINGLLSFLLSGKKPDELMDYVMPRDGGVTEDGHESRIMLPTYLAKDIHSWFTNPAGTAAAKLSPPLAWLAGILRNEDSQHHHIRGKGGIGAGKYTAGFVTPYSVQGIVKNRERGVSWGKTLAPSLGVMPASRRVGISKAEEIIAEYQDENRAAVRPVTTQYAHARAQVLIAARSRDLAKAREIGREAGIQPEDMKKTLQRARLTPLVANFKNVRDLNIALRVYDAATPQERAQIQQLAVRKVRSALSKPGDWEDPETAELAQKYFHLRPRRQVMGDFAAPAAVQ